MDKYQECMVAQTQKHFVMSKGINIFNHFNPPKSDGHKVVDHDIHGPRVYCPFIKDTITSTYTSSGIICGHCKKTI